jgi:hypothetical protein
MMADGAVEPKLLKSAVLIGLIPLAAVTKFVLTEGVKVAQVAGSATFTHVVAPSTKTIAIDAILIGKQRAFRPALELLALSNRFAAALGSVGEQFTGVPVVARLGVHVDMQITDLVFTQDNTIRDAFTVSIKLSHVPRSTIAEAIGAGLDLAMGVAGGFIP